MLKKIAGDYLSIKDAYLYPYDDKQKGLEDFERAVNLRTKYYTKHDAQLQDKLKDKIPTIPDPRQNGKLYRQFGRITIPENLPVKYKKIGRPQVTLNKFDYQPTSVELPTTFSLAVGNKDYVKKHEFGHYPTITERGSGNVPTWIGIPDGYGDLIAPKIRPDFFNVRLLPFGSPIQKDIIPPQNIADRASVIRSNSKLAYPTDNTPYIKRYGNEFNKFYTYYGAPEEFTTTAHNIKAIGANRGIKERHNFDKMLNIDKLLDVNSLSKSEKQFVSDFSEIREQLNMYRKRIQELQNTKENTKLLKSLQDEYDQVYDLYKHYFDMSRRRTNTGKLYNV